MTSYGQIVKLKNNRAFVVSPQTGYVTIKRKPGMMVGQLINFETEDTILNNKINIKYLSMAAGLTAVLVFAVMFWKMNTGIEPFVYVDIDINPSIEFIVNENKEVMEAVSLNKDGNVILKETDCEGMLIQDAIEKIIERSEKYGYIQSNRENLVLISAVLNMQKGDKAQEKYRVMLKQIEETVNSADKNKIIPKVIESTLENRNLAQKNNVSMGRYFVYTVAKEKGLKLEIEDVKKASIEQIYREAEIEADGSNNKDKEGWNQAEDLIKPTPMPTPNIHTKVPSFTDIPTLIPISTASNRSVAAKPTLPPTPRPTLLPKSIVDDWDDGVIYSEGWSRQENELYINSTASVSNIAEASVQFTFNGSSIRWYGIIGPEKGKADVYIDGAFDVTIDCYNSGKNTYRALLYNKSGLSNAEHTIKIVSKIGSLPIAIDAFQYKP